MVCPMCGEGVDRGRTGRPRTYCSRSCQARAYRRRRDEGRLSAVRTGTSAAAGEESLVDDAIGLADDQGIHALTLRSLAHRRGQALVTLQRDLGSRDRLVALMVQRVFGGPADASGRADGEALVDVLARLALAEWQAYRAHPWLVEVMTTTRPPLVPAVLAQAEAVIAAFTELGIVREEAFGRYLALSAYIQGMATLVVAEEQETGRTETSYRAWWLDQFRALDRTGATTRHPWLATLGDTRSADAFDADATFRAGLPRIIRGLTASDRSL
ncbi:transcriptional regulator, TetR family [Brevibacterium jeotgali]|uniref:Transcriptional regulator, TetR family n=2 Tax=Brevibacterium jeotgali TaxID=1262550 RepID=A0A2H1L7K9_9MICO|nr:tetracycline repressor-like protein [Brevibacterium jeotgali]SMY12867.1 transcriptional regulator, TetR family [Brevibacterium jeotgali]